MATGTGLPTDAPKEGVAAPRPSGRIVSTPRRAETRPVGSRGGSWGCLGAPLSLETGLSPPLTTRFPLGAVLREHPQPLCPERASRSRTPPLVNSSAAQLRREGHRHLLEAGLGLDQICFEPRGVPELDLRTHTGYGDFALESRVLAQMLRDEDPALLVDRTFDRARDHHARVRLGLGVDHRDADDPILELLPVLEGMQLEAPVGVGEDRRVIAAPLELRPEPGREAHAVLAVDRMHEAASEHLRLGAREPSSGRVVVVASARAGSEPVCTT